MEERLRNLEEIVKLQFEVLQGIINYNDLCTPDGTYDNFQRIKKLRWPILGKKVRRFNGKKKKWDNGKIVLYSFAGKDQEYFIDFNDNTHEQLIGLPYEIMEGECWVKGTIYK